MLNSQVVEGNKVSFDGGSHIGTVVNVARTGADSSDRDRVVVGSIDPPIPDTETIVKFAHDLSPVVETPNPPDPVVKESLQASDSEGEGADEQVEETPVETPASKKKKGAIQ